VTAVSFALTNSDALDRSIVSALSPFVQRPGEPRPVGPRATGLLADHPVHLTGAQVDRINRSILRSEYTGLRTEWQNRGGTRQAFDNLTRGQLDVLISIRMHFGSLRAVANDTIDTRHSGFRRERFIDAAVRGDWRAAAALLREVRGPHTFESRRHREAAILESASGLPSPGARSLRR